MAGLPKKYAKMGFSKGWKAYKATKKRPKVRAAKSSKSQVKHMAKRKANPIDIGRGLMYIGLPSLEVYNTYNALKAAGRTTGQAAQEAIMHQVGQDTAMVNGVITKLPWDATLAWEKNDTLVYWTAIDFTADKVGAYRHIKKIVSKVFSWM